MTRAHICLSDTTRARLRAYRDAHQLAGYAQAIERLLGQQERLAKSIELLCSAADAFRLIGPPSPTSLRNLELAALTARHTLDS